MAVGAPPAPVRTTPFRPAAGRAPLLAVCRCPPAHLAAAISRRRARPPPLALCAAPPRADTLPWVAPDRSRSLEPSDNLSLYAQVMRCQQVAPAQLLPIMVHVLARAWRVAFQVPPRVQREAVQLDRSATQGGQHHRQQSGRGVIGPPHPAVSAAPAGVQGKVVVQHGVVFQHQARERPRRGGGRVRHHQNRRAVGGRLAPVRWHHPRQLVQIAWVRRIEHAHCLSAPHKLLIPTHWCPIDAPDRVMCVDLAAARTGGGQNAAGVTDHRTAPEVHVAQRVGWREEADAAGYRHTPRGLASRGAELLLPRGLGQYDGSVWLLCLGDAEQAAGREAGPKIDRQQRAIRQQDLPRAGHPRKDGDEHAVARHKMWVVPRDAKAGAGDVGATASSGPARRPHAPSGT
eukprot:scaffold14801_cov105-Isochrysis_galbana.AAC.6